MGAKTWSAQQETMLRERYPQISASKLAGELYEKTGGSFSRSAVIARARRMGVAKTTEERSAVSSQAQLERRGRLGHHSHGVAANVMRQKARPDQDRIRRQVEKFEQAASPDHLGLVLIDFDFLTGKSAEDRGLKLDQCRFPHGSGGEITFCGQPQQEDSAYCCFHHRICYRPPEARPVRPMRRAA